MLSLYLSSSLIDLPENLVLNLTFSSPIFDLSGIDRAFS
jgi:hypothetical protein